MENNVGCQLMGQPPSRRGVQVIVPKKRTVPPRFRVTKAKGNYYVQVRGIQGDERWYSLGKLSPETLDIARRLVINEWKERTDTLAEEIKKRYGVGERDLSHLPSSVWEREAELDWEAQQTYIEKMLEAHRREKELRKKALRKLVKKLRIQKFYMRREDFERLMQKDPEQMTPEERELRDETKRAYEEGRIILK